MHFINAFYIFNAIIHTYLNSTQMQPLFYSNSTIPHYPQSYADFDQVYACYQNAAHPYALLLMKTI